MRSVESVLARIRPHRTISGLAAALLPHDDAGHIDAGAFVSLLERIWAAGLTPAVNMDTGYVNLLSHDERYQILAVTRNTAAGRAFVAGAYVENESGAPHDTYLREVEAIQRQGGTPILFPCSACAGFDDEQIIELHRHVASACDRVLFFELGSMFVPFGRIYSLDVVRHLMQIPQAVGMKHSSLDRELEWQRLDLRDGVRPDFRIYTGNDLGIDMVMYGSDYLLGLAVFAPDVFALRDSLWAAGDAAFYAANDVLQAIGRLAFRPPVPGYRHN